MIIMYVALDSLCVVMMPCASIISYIGAFATYRAFSLEYKGAIQLEILV